jgi:ketosteroid isomerase-like protein
MSARVAGCSVALVDNVQLVRDTWDALSRGDLAPLEAVLAPDAKWRAVQDGPWNCQSRAAIVDVMTRNLAEGLSGHIEEVLPLADRVVVAFRPDHHEPGAWPLDHGIRYVVITVAQGHVTEMKGCADRKTALAYAGANQA